MKTRLKTISPSLVLEQRCLQKWAGKKAPALDLLYRVFSIMLSLNQHLISIIGRIEPVQASEKLAGDFTGLGKTTKDNEVLTAAVGSRRELVSERISRESDEQRLEREVSLDTETAIHSYLFHQESQAKKIKVTQEITAVLKNFYCDVCHKQYKIYKEFDERKIGSFASNETS